VSRTETVLAIVAVAALAGLVIDVWVFGLMLAAAL
jgi:hypothetical protein